MHDVRLQGVWQWDTSFGDPNHDRGTDYENWRLGEPNNDNAGEDCVETVPGDGGGWNDVDCNLTLPFVCQQGEFSSYKTWEVAEFMCGKFYP